MTLGKMKEGKEKPCKQLCVSPRAREWYWLAGCSPQSFFWRSLCRSRPQKSQPPFCSTVYDTLSCSCSAALIRNGCERENNIVATLHNTNTETLHVSISAFVFLRTNEPPSLCADNCFLKLGVFETLLLWLLSCQSLSAFLRL